MNKDKKVILDCHPGHDDAISIILAASAVSIPSSRSDYYGCWQCGSGEEYIKCAKGL